VNSNLRTIGEGLTWFYYKACFSTLVGLR